uniref:Uncharacterized protein n=1 Tax=Rhizophora mucronata TaxID=61149 RepID=A0A2P2PH54_RHIMU
MLRRKLMIYSLLR